MRLNRQALIGLLSSALVVYGTAGAVFAQADYYAQSPQPQGQSGSVWQSLGNKLLDSVGGAISRRFGLNNQDATTWPPVAPPASNSFGYSAPPSYAPHADASDYGATGANVTRVLTKRDLSIIGNHDVVVLVDKSGSMTEKDCPAPFIGAFGFLAGGRSGMLSRWDWCREQIYSLSKQAAPVLRNGLTLVFFDKDANVFPNVMSDQIPQLFANTTPGGGTNMAKAVKQQMDDYFARRGYGARPLAMVIITDGVPDSAQHLKSVICDATRKMSRPGEISISFLQVGQDRGGSSLLFDLTNLQSEGAEYNIVDSHPFAQVAQEGLGRALVESIEAHDQSVSYR